MSPKQQSAIVFSKARVVLGLVVYNVLEQPAMLLQIVQFLLFPSFLATGLIIWQMPRLNKWLHNRR